jgi:hypothetical protein
MQTATRSLLVLVVSATAAQAAYPQITDVVLRPERGPADTANRGNVRTYGVTWGEASQIVSPRGGLYHIRWSENAWGDVGNRLRLTSVDVMQQQVTAALSARAVGMVADTSASTRSRIPTTGPGAAPVTQRPLIAARVPFQILDGDGRPVANVAMFQRHERGNASDSMMTNARTIGAGVDTVRVTIPPDVWMPGDTLYVFERTPDGAEVFAMRLVLACSPAATAARVTCNPLTLGTRGATGYLPYLPGWINVVDLRRSERRP